MPHCHIGLFIALIAGLFLVKAIARRRFARYAYGYGGFGGGPCGGGGGCGPGGYGFHGHHGHHGGYGGDWAPWERGGSSGGWGGPPWARGRGGWGRGFVLRAVFGKLQATPSQQKEITEAVDDFKKVAHEAKEELKASRENVARAVGGEVFDEIAIGEASVAADRATGKVKEAFEASLRRIHAVLDPKQREIFAEIVAIGPRAFGFGPYR